MSFSSFYMSLSLLSLYSTWLKRALDEVWYWLKTSNARSLVALFSSYRVFKLSGIGPVFFLTSYHACLILIMKRVIVCITRSMTRAIAKHRNKNLTPFIVAFRAKYRLVQNPAEIITPTRDKRIERCSSQNLAHLDLFLNYSDLLVFFSTSNGVILKGSWLAI